MISVLDITDPKYKFTERGLLMVFLLMMLNTMAVNIDHGAIPQATISIKEDLSINNAELGELGSLVFLGLAVGALSASLVFGRVTYKTILSMSFIGNGVGLLFFSILTQYYYLCFSRFLSGFC